MDTHFKREDILYALKGINFSIHSLFIFTAIHFLDLTPPSQFLNWSEQFLYTCLAECLFLCSFLQSAFGASRRVRQVSAIVTSEHLEDISCSVCPSLRFLIL